MHVISIWNHKTHNNCNNKKTSQPFNQPFQLPSFYLYFLFVFVGSFYSVAHSATTPCHKVINNNLGSVKILCINISLEFSFFFLSPFSILCSTLTCKRMFTHCKTHSHYMSYLIEMRRWAQLYFFFWIDRAALFY